MKYAMSWCFNREPVANRSVASATPREDENIRLGHLNRHDFGSFRFQPRVRWLEAKRSSDLAPKLFSDQVVAPLEELDYLVSDEVANDRNTQTDNEHVESASDDPAAGKQTSGRSNCEVRNHRNGERGPHRQRP